MRRAILCTLMLAGGLALSAASGPSAGGTGDRVVSGKGTIRFGNKDNGRAMFEFTIDGTGSQPVGEILFAGEDHGAMGLYPDIIIRADEILSLKINGRQATIVAEGFLHDDPIHITIVVVDAVGTTSSDWFSIKTIEEHQLDGGAHGNLDISAYLWSGNIDIGTPG